MLGGQGPTENVRLFCVLNLCIEETQFTVNQTRALLGLALLYSLSGESTQPYCPVGIAKDDFSVEEAAAAISEAGHHA